MQSDETGLLIESTLPKQFLQDLGAYLQTCAHIELIACTFICHTEGLSIRSPEWNMRFHRLRKERLSDLIELLRKAGEKLPGSLGREFAGFVDWIDQNKLNRHIAVHGAFFPLQSEGLFRVMYTHKSKTENGIEYREEETKLDRAAVGTILKDADRILRILSGISMAIDRGELILSDG